MFPYQKLGFLSPAGSQKHQIGIKISASLVGNLILTNVRLMSLEITEIQYLPPPNAETNFK